MNKFSKEIIIEREQRKLADVSEAIWEKMQEDQVEEEKYWTERDYGRGEGEEDE